MRPRQLLGQLPRLIAVLLLSACRSQGAGGDERRSGAAEQPANSLALQPRLVEVSPARSVSCVDRLGNVQLIREGWVPIPLPYLVQRWRDEEDSLGELELAAAPPHERGCGRSRVSFMRTPNELRLEARRFEACHRTIAYGSAAEVDVHASGTVLPNGEIVDVRAKSDIQDSELAAAVEQCIEARIEWNWLPRSTPRFTHFELDLRFVGHPRNAPGNDGSREPPRVGQPSCDSDELPHDELTLPRVIVDWEQRTPLPNDGPYDPNWRRDYVGALHCDFVACLHASAPEDSAAAKWTVVLHSNPAGHPAAAERIHISAEWASPDRLPLDQAMQDCLRSVFRDVRWPQHRSHPGQVNFRLKFEPMPQPLEGSIRDWTAPELQTIRTGDPRARAQLLESLADSPCSHAWLGLEAALIDSGGVVDESVEAELARVRETILALPHAQAWSCQWSGVELLLAVLHWPLDGDQRSNSYILGAGLGAREVLARVRPWLRLGTELDPRIELAIVAIAARAVYLGHMTHDEPGFSRKQ